MVRSSWVVRGPEVSLVRPVLLEPGEPRVSWDSLETEECLEPLD